MASHDDDMTMEPEEDFEVVIMRLVPDRARGQRFRAIEGEDVLEGPKPRSHQRVI